MLFAQTDASGQRFNGKNYSLVFHDDGRVYIYLRDGGQNIPVGRVGEFAFPSANIKSASKVKIDTALKPQSEKETVRFENIATALDIQKSIWPVVNVEYAIDSGTLRAEWKLMPETVQVKFHITPKDDKDRKEGPATLAFITPAKATLTEQVKVPRWNRHPLGGVPYQLSAGDASRYTVGHASFVIAVERGVPESYDAGKKQINLFVQTVKRPWATDLLQGTVVFCFDKSAVAMPMAVACAGDDPLMMTIKSPSPFYLWDEVQKPIQLKACIANLSTLNQRVDVRYIARDIDGTVIGQATPSRRLDPLQIWELPIKITPKDIGPIFLEVQSQHASASVIQYVTVGVMPKRDFKDGEESRFGIAAYRGYVGAHTELRTDQQILELMQRIGVRWLRTACDSKLARQLGFYTWYPNGLGALGQDYFKGKPTWMDSPKNREDYLRGNLQRTLDQGDVCFEFSNEWNLWGGDNRGVLAERYVRDWMIPLKKLRDQMAPKVKLAGCVIANGDLVYLDKVFKAGGWNTFDYLVFHAAGVPRSPDYDDANNYWTFLGTLRRIHDALRQYGKKELWITETYSPSAPNSSCSNNERVAAEDIALIYGLGVAADVRGIMLYCLDDFDLSSEIQTAAQVGEPIERESYWGLVRRDWMPKVGLWSYQTSAYLLDGAKFLGDVVLADKNLRGLLFETPKGKLALLWSRKEGFLQQAPSSPRLTHRQAWEDSWTERTSLSFKGKSPVDIYDFIGRTRRVTPDKNGNITLDLTGAPIYVLGGDFETCKGPFYQMFH